MCHISLAMEIFTKLFSVLILTAMSLERYFIVCTRYGNPFSDISLPYPSDGVTPSLMDYCTSHYRLPSSSVLSFQWQCRFITLSSSIYKTTWETHIYLLFFSLYFSKYIKSVFDHYNLWPFRWQESFIVCVLMRCLTSCSLHSSLIHSSWDSLVSNRITHLSIFIYRIAAPLAIMALCYIFLVRHVRAKFRKRTNNGERSMKWAVCKISWWPLDFEVEGICLLISSKSKNEPMNPFPIRE